MAKVALVAAGGDVALAANELISGALKQTAQLRAACGLGAAKMSGAEKIEALEKCAAQAKVELQKGGVKELDVPRALKEISQAESADAWKAYVTR